MLKPPEDNDLFAKCLREHGMGKLFILPIGDSYRYLQGAARHEREYVDIGVKELEETFKTLANYDKGESVKELEEVAKALLFFTQFLSEAVRIIPQADMIIGAFNSNEAIRIPDWILLLHHGSRPSGPLAEADSLFCKMKEAGYSLGNTAFITMLQRIVLLKAASKP
ncbi:hypothetical protein POM88_022367 [Heracleum sosnowskyi]|uniref:rRNA N-glycosylase n=1 Tax=Heracleum sosnowskyi TaxID=360622 RepID=A0AAD8MTQ7_9APIA|nr:hypothetical protein POM88_022367 [Heracleum sosnowskyi]